MSLILWKNLKNVGVVFYIWLFWITLKTSIYPLHQYVISLNNFWNPNKQLKYLGSWWKEFFSNFFFKENKFISITTKIPQDASLYMRLLHEKHKYPICVIRMKYPERKLCPNNSFYNSYCNWKHFSLFLNQKSKLTKGVKFWSEQLKENLQYLNTTDRTVSSKKVILKE